jgi:N-acyl homoserine lactone hydrolase
MRVVPLLIGGFQVNERVLYRNGNPSQSVEFSSYAFYVEDGTEKIMVDTGFGDARYCIEHLGREVTTPLGMTLADHLKRLAVDPSEIKTVILTHCHWDHIGGLGLFEKAAIYCQCDEIPLIVSPPAWLAESYAPSFSHLIMEARERLQLIEGDYALSEKLFLRKVGGHTPGSQNVEVRGKHREVIIAGDALFYFDNLSKQIPNGEGYDLDESVRTLQNLRNKTIESSGTIVLPGHDPELWKIHRAGIEV